MRMTQKELYKKLEPYSQDHGLVHWGDEEHLKLVSQLGSISRYNVWDFHGFEVNALKRQTPIEIRLSYVWKEKVFHAAIVFGRGKRGTPGYWEHRVKDQITHKDLQVVKKKVWSWLKKYKWNWKPKDTVTHFKGDVLCYKFKFDNIDKLLMLGGRG